ncbi:MAG: sulfotransferase [Gammaproteobacteria bacterium]|nr:sulfotransferase [Gammaproteobacteria bacterium]
MHPVIAPIFSRLPVVWRISSHTRQIELYLASSLRNATYKLGLTPAHRNYTRFIILSRSRSGTNFLRGLLNSHPAIRCFSEVFGAPDSVKWGMDDLPDHVSHHTRQMKNRPDRFVETKVYGPVPSRIQAVGFKIFYYHAAEAPTQHIWDWLHHHSEIKVIHMMRRNLLDTAISLRLAQASGSWKVSKASPNTGSDRAGPLVSIDPDWCQEVFEQTTIWQKSAEKWFCDHDILNLYYEDLREDPNREIKRCLDFLHLPQAKLDPNTIRQSKKNRADKVANFQRLKEHFSGTTWRHFFD